MKNFYAQADTLSDNSMVANVMFEDDDGPSREEFQVCAAVTPDIAEQMVDALNAALALNDTLPLRPDDNADYHAEARLRLMENGL